ncbi:hypothetical protein LCGC14_2915530 [marine sediment metagenome]|uniref:AB hydrolase-1 domain-containing protein n=1 Tax=marine sediment metagenome TaxID=412755 RepID=A0A0F8XQE4_9ZZZZ
MNIILIPGLFAPAGYLDPLREVLEDAGHTCYGPGFEVNTLLSGEFQTLIETLEEFDEPAVLVGHSAGGMLAVQAAQAKHPAVAGVIGLGSSVVGLMELEVPHYEGRSLLGGLMVPLVGPDEVKVFPVGHSTLPLTPCVHEWVLDKLEEIDA